MCMLHERGREDRKAGERESNLIRKLIALKLGAGDIAESGLTGGGTSDTVITSSFVKDETTPELTGENKSYKEEDADERSNTKEEV